MFTCPTAARAGEVLGARWVEIDFDGRLRIVPADRMKASVEHRVPMTDEAIVPLREQEQLRSLMLFEDQKRHALQQAGGSPKREPPPSWFA